MRYRLVLKRQASQGRWQKWTEKIGPILLRPWRGSEAVRLHSSATGRSHHPLARKPCSVLNNYKYFRPFAQRFPFNFISKSSYAIQTSLEPDGWVEQRTRGLMACVCNSKAGKQIVAAKWTAQTCEICQLPDWDRGNGIVGIRQPVYELGKRTNRSMRSRCCSLVSLFVLGSWNYPPISTRCYRSCSPCQAADSSMCSLSLIRLLCCAEGFKFVVNQVLDNFFFPVLMVLCVWQLTKTWFQL